MKGACRARRYYGEDAGGKSLPAVYELRPPRSAVERFVNSKTPRGSAPIRGTVPPSPATRPVIAVEKPQPVARRCAQCQPGAAEREERNSTTRGVSQGPPGGGACGLRHGVQNRGL